MTRSFDQFHDIEMDVLKEIGNIGAGHAATALSTLLNRPIDMGSPRFSVSPLN